MNYGSHHGTCNGAYMYTLVESCKTSRGSPVAYILDVLYSLIKGETDYLQLILEAQSYSDYTIATRVGGIPEIVDQTNGVLFEPADQEALYKILQYVNNDKPYSDKTNLIKNSSRLYLPEYVSEQLETLYLLILNT